MNKLNFVGYSKAVFVLAFAIFNYFLPLQYNPTEVIELILATAGALVVWTGFGTLITVVIVKKFKGNFTKANWNKNPFRLLEPSNTIQFLGVGEIIFGLANLVGAYLNHSVFSVYGLQNLLTGIGLLLSLKFSQRVLTGANTRHTP